MMSQNFNNFRNETLQHCKNGVSVLITCCQVESDASADLHVFIMSREVFQPFTERRRPLFGVQPPSCTPQ
jgi:hypothetical protein